MVRVRWLAGESPSAGLSEYNPPRKGTLMRHRDFYISPQGWTIAIGWRNRLTIPLPRRMTREEVFDALVNVQGVNKRRSARTVATEILEALARTMQPR